ncbi:hypothetical protein FZEAL_4491 [Fusarium zealandicum]|uniref:DUF7708 domain-containing protein n=1 Tax=Fusarium zealandicum TaxID=1053134 RepID=A0A8H4XLH8_9HYPO|nr:hypothetical protein FZEAL_4491 [Fusarium zealandicum]
MYLDGSDIAEDAFKTVKQHFEQSTSLSSQEKALIETTSCLEDVQKTVATSMAKYEARTESSKIRKWLKRASETICYYNQVLDVFVQHHPEYVALAWGLMKLLFITAVNHGETLKLLSKTISEVATRLPRIKVLSTLYRTEQMRFAIESLYSAILEFLLIAHSWCNESKLRHLYHSFTRPHELQYADLLERITTSSKNIDELATVGSQAEIRVMHGTHSGKLGEIISALEESENNRKNQFDGLSCAVSKLQISSKEQEKKLDLIMERLEYSGLSINNFLTRIETAQSILTSAQVDTNQRITDLQLSQALSSFAQRFEDPDQCYKHNLFLRNRRASGKGRITSTNKFWLSPKLAHWTSSRGSAMMIVKGSFTTRLAVQDFGVDVIQALATSAIPTLWALTSAQRSRSDSILTTTDLVKYLTYQALQLGGAINTEKQMSLRYSQLHTARTLGEWLNLFRRVIEALGEQVYLVLDLGNVRSQLEGVDGINFIQELNRMLNELSQPGTSTKIKVILLIYEAEWFKLIPTEISGHIVPVKSASASASAKRPQGKEMRRAVNMDATQSSESLLPHTIRVKDDGANPFFLYIGAKGYHLQSQVFRVPQRFGVFSPGPPLLQVHQAIFVTFFAALFVLEFFISSAVVSVLYSKGGSWLAFMLVMLVIRSGVAIFLWASMTFRPPNPWL